MYIAYNNIMGFTFKYSITYSLMNYDSYEKLNL